jgi:hypothetical protein
MNKNDIKFQNDCYPLAFLIIPFGMMTIILGIWKLIEIIITIFNYLIVK